MTLKNGDYTTAESNAIEFILSIRDLISSGYEVFSAYQYDFDSSIPNGIPKWDTEWDTIFSRESP